MDRQVATAEGEDLLRLALSRPRDAVASARDLMARTQDPTAVSYARQALGIVLRDGGDMPGAVAELRAAGRAARTAGGGERVADVRATLGATLVMDGRTALGLRALDSAASESRGQLRARVLMRRAYVLSVLGRHEESLHDLTRALAGFRRAGDVVWEARTLNNRGSVHIARGSVDLAERDVTRAGQLFAAAGQELEATHALHNRAVIAYCTGDLPRAFTLMDQAAERYEALGVPSSDLVIDRCVVLLAARLTSDALEHARSALAGGPLQPRHSAELQLLLASAALISGDGKAALVASRAARRLFHQQHRDWWSDRAELVVARARYESGDRKPGLLGTVVEVAGRLEAARADEAPGALLLAGRLAAAQHLDSCHDYFGAAARYRQSASSLVRATAWLALALDREVDGTKRGVLSACARGLDALDEHRITLGDAELRALSTLHGQELAEIALRHAAQTGSARQLLRWSERWRATALSQPPVHPPDDEDLAAELAAMRGIVRQLDEARGRNLPTVALVEERARWEAAIRRRRRHLVGAAGRPVGLDIGNLVDRLAQEGVTLIELVEVGANLHALVIRRGHVRRFDVGPVADGLRAVERARFALRQAARRRPTELRGAGRQLEAALLGPAVRSLGEEEVVIAPPSRLQDAPWGLLPALAGRPTSTIPSAALWMRAAQVQPPQRMRTVLIAGPDLPSRGAEIDAIAAGSPDAVVLRGPSATVRGSLTALDGASLALIAAHGRYRGDSPMFSSLMLADGPLTVHDFEGLRRPPYRLLLSACDSGVMAPVGANGLLGLAGVLLSLGAAGVLCSLAEVDDEATVELMVAVHRGLEGGESPAEALRSARMAACGDVLHEATAATFVALGI